MTGPITTHSSSNGTSNLLLGNGKFIHRRIMFHPAQRASDSSVLQGQMQLKPLNDLDDKIVPNGVKQNGYASKNNENGNGSCGVLGKRVRPENGKLDHQQAERGNDEEFMEMLEWGAPMKIGAGLSNLGNTCFLNSVLQCLTYTPPLAKFLKSGQHKPDCRNAGFCAMCALEGHVKQALGAWGKVVSPTYLVKNLRSISRAFQPCRQEDAHEYMRYLIEALHRCCFRNKAPPTSNNDKSLIYRTFGGRLKSEVKCTDCSYCSDTVDPFLDLSLDIVRADSLPKALARFTAEEVLDGDNRYQCEKCKRKVRALKRFSIECAPNILTIQFKRFASSGHFGSKIDKKVNFGIDLDVKPFMSNSQSLRYQLYAVLVHSGSSTHSGHYFCYVRTSTGVWHLLDDSRVQQVSERTVLEQKAYILFYSRISNTDAKKKPPASISNNVVSGASSLMESVALNSQGNGISKRDLLSEPLQLKQKTSLQETLARHKQGNGVSKQIISSELLTLSQNTSLQRVQEALPLNNHSNGVRKNIVLSEPMQPNENELHVDQAHVKRVSKNGPPSPVVSPKEASSNRPKFVGNGVPKNIVLSEPMQPNENELHMDQAHVKRVSKNGLSPSPVVSPKEASSKRLKLPDIEMVKTNGHGITKTENIAAQDRVSTRLQKPDAQDHIILGDNEPDEVDNREQGVFHERGRNGKAHELLRKLSHLKRHNYRKLLQALPSSKRLFLGKAFFLHQREKHHLVGISGVLNSVQHSNRKQRKLAAPAVANGVQHSNHKRKKGAASVEEKMPNKGSAMDGTILHRIQDRNVNGSSMLSDNGHNTVRILTGPAAERSFLEDCSNHIQDISLEMDSGCSNSQKTAHHISENGTQPAFMSGTGLYGSEVAGWTEEDDRKDVDLLLKSEHKPFSRTLDKWDEEYDRGKVKKLRKGAAGRRLSACQSNGSLTADANPAVHKLVNGNPFQALASGKTNM